MDDDMRTARRREKDESWNAWFQFIQVCQVWSGDIGVRCRCGL